MTIDEINKACQKRQEIWTEALGRRFAQLTEVEALEVRQYEAIIAAGFDAKRRERAERTVSAGTVSASTGGWRIENAGRTGNPCGKPTRGITNPALISQRFADAVALTCFPVAEMRAVLRRGRPRAKAGEIRVALAGVIVTLLAGSRPLNVSAFASWLGCHPSTLYNLNATGEKQLESRSPRAPERMPWGFRRERILDCARGHRSYSPDPESWVGRACWHNQTCNDALRIVTEPNPNVIPLRKEGRMITTDDQLALDATRLAEMAADVFSIAIKFQARFPSSSILSETVDRLIAAATDPKELERAA